MHITMPRGNKRLSISGLLWTIFCAIVITCSLILGFGAMIGCASIGTDTTSPAQKAINATALVCSDNDAAIKAADQAVLAGVLKGNDARTAVKGLTAIQTGCVATLAAMQAAGAAASAASAPR